MSDPTNEKPKGRTGSKAAKPAAEPKQTKAAKPAAERTVDLKPAPEPKRAKPAAEPKPAKQAAEPKPAPQSRPGPKPAPEPAPEPEAEATSRPLWAPDPEKAGGASQRKPDAPHSSVISVPTDYQADPGERYRRIAAREGGNGSVRGARQEAAGADEAEGAGDVDQATPMAAAAGRPSVSPSAAADSSNPPSTDEATTPDWVAARTDMPALVDIANGSLADVAAVPVPVAPAHHARGSEHCRDHAALRIAHLYPSLLNVAGDGGNLMALQRRAEWRDIPVEVVAVEKGQTPDFRRFDIVLFHGGQDVEMAVAAADLERKAPSLRAAAAEGVVIFAVCAGLQLLGHRYVSNAGEEMLGAGILDLETRGGPQRFMQHAACEVEMNGATETVVGFENHSGLTDLGPGCEPFGRVIAGAGNNGRDGLEGARSGNTFATYLHGPVLPKNPWLTDQLLRVALGRCEGIPVSRVSLAPLDDAAEQRAHGVALAKAMANRGRRTALEPAKLVRGK